MTPDCVADVRAVLGEGPVWVAAEQALYWLDVKGRAIFRMDDDGVERFETPMRVGSIAPRRAGGFVAGTEHGLALVDRAIESFDIFCDPEPERPGNRFNDGKVDRQGRFWAGTMDDAEREASGALYRIDADREWTRMDDGYRVTNGPAFSPDGRTLYHSDSALQTIYRFDLDEAGRIGPRSVFARFGEGDGHPDGMTTDAEGCVWIAFWDGWCVRRLSPKGECIQEIAMPVQRPTSCAFGGPALDRLYVTSARIDLDEKSLAMQPYAGGLFVLEPGVVGLVELPFSG